MYPLNTVFILLAFISYSNSPASKTEFQPIYLHVQKLNLETWVSVKCEEAYRVTNPKLNKNVYKYYVLICALVTETNPT